MRKRRVILSEITWRILSFLVAGVLFCCGTAYAELGIDWVKYNSNPVLNVGAHGSWEDAHVQKSVVIKDGDIYKMWYGGTNLVRSRTGYATSLDGITWIKYNGNPVLNEGSDGAWDYGAAGICTVIKDGSIYKAWYGGHNAYTSNGRIGYATSTDGITWTKYAGNPVLNLGPNGTWDDNSVSTPCVIKDGETYKMWYVGLVSGGQGHWHIGYATSPDGITWTKYSGNPVLTTAGGTWQIAPFVLKENNIYKMWYGDMEGSAGGNIRICYATSTDGINWVKYPANPVIRNDGVFDGQHALAPWIINDNGDYKMWYTGQNSGQMKIGYAISYSTPTTPPGFTCNEDELRVLAEGQTCDVLNKLDELRGCVDDIESALGLSNSDCSDVIVKINAMKECISETQSALNLNADTCPADVLVTILVPPGILNPAVQSALKNNPNAATVVGVVTNQPHAVPFGK